MRTYITYVDEMCVQKRRLLFLSLEGADSGKETPKHTYQENLSEFV